MDKKIYMDYSATTYIKEEVLNEMMPYLTKYFGNPSAIHSMSREVKKAVMDAKIKTAKAINAHRDEIFFTSGGTESDNWAIKGIASRNKNKGKHIITTKIEHKAILNSCKYLEENGFKVTYLTLNEEGMIRIEDLKNAITKDTILVSVMFANNEIGSIQPIKEIGKICREKNIIFHTDAVQAIGSVPIDVNEMNIDLLSMAGHKFYGPKGVGALYIRKGVKIDNLLHGGSQERGKRSGTENVAGIVGLGKAIELASHNLEKESSRLRYLRDKLIDGLLKIPDTRLNGPTGERRLPGNVNVSFKGVNSGTLLIILDNMGIYASAGSACTAGSLEPSHVLLSIGVPEDLAKSSIRFTLGASTTEDDVDYVLKIMPEVIENIRNTHLE